MKAKHANATGLFTISAMLLLIFDSKTASRGVYDGINLCLLTVIPSLFPFLFLSVLLTKSIKIKPNSPVCILGKLCRIPSGSEIILLTGLLAGYPVGAQSIATAYRSGSLTKEDAKRMLGFCSNAGPAFIFGMTTQLFSQPIISLLLWLIHISSALITGVLLPGCASGTYNGNCSKSISASDALRKAIQSMGLICGWIIIFRVIITYLERWFIHNLPPVITTVIYGITELSNGFIALNTIADDALRFILCSCMLAFGGICVLMQTVGVTADLSCSNYLLGKTMQTLVSFILSSTVTALIFHQQHLTFLPVLLILLIAIPIVTLSKTKKVVAIKGKMLYNNKKLN